MNRKPFPQCWFYVLPFVYYVRLLWWEVFATALINYTLKLINHLHISLNELESNYVFKLVFLHCHFNEKENVLIFRKCNFVKIVLFTRQGYKFQSLPYVFCKFSYVETHFGCQYHKVSVLLWIHNVNWSICHILPCIWNEIFIWERINVYS